MWSLTKNYNQIFIQVSHYIIEGSDDRVIHYFTCSFCNKLPAFFSVWSGKNLLIIYLNFISDFYKKKRERNKIFLEMTICIHV